MISHLDNGPKPKGKECYSWAKVAVFKATVIDKIAIPARIDCRMQDI